MDTYILATLLALLVFLPFYLSRNHRYWQKRGIPCAKNIRPILGNAPVLAFIRYMGDLCNAIYRDHSKHSMVGFYNYNAPILMVRDPELVKSVLVTNFASFSDNDIILNDDEEPLLSKNPFFTNGTAWKMARTRLTSSFTGTKLKTYSQDVLEVTRKLTRYIDAKMQSSPDGATCEIECKQLFSRVTAEVAANVGFGVEGHCFDDAKDKESFAACGKLFFDDSWSSKIKVLVMMHMPALLYVLRIPFISKEFQAVFEQLVQRSLENRKGKDRARHYVDLMIDLEEKQGDLEKRHREILSHMLTFFLDTYETSSVALTFFCYNLAVNKGEQEKVRKEVLEVVKRNGGLNYEAVGEMVYLEQALYESLRLFPPALNLIKKCTQETELVGPDGLRCVLEPEIRVYVPVECLHKDPSFWEDPEAFRPERFSRERVAERSRTVHLPFGDGPRMCPGMKLATMVNKMTMAALLMNYEWELSSKTKMPLEMDLYMVLPHVKGGMWIKFRKLK